MVSSDIQELQVGDLGWAYRECCPNTSSGKPPVVLLHGLVSQSYSWRDVMPALADRGFRAIAPDWIGHGFSAKPDRRQFDYSPDGYARALGDLLDSLELERVSLVVQGFLGAAGLLYATAHADRIAKLVVLNAPLPPAAAMPMAIKMMGWPAVGEIMTQDPLLVDRTLEGGGPYQVDDDDLDVYRRPFLKSSDVGRSLMWAMRAMKMPKLTAQLAQGFQTWERPTLVAWGTADPWLSAAQAKAFAQGLSDGEYVELDEVGHYAQEDWADKVSEAVVPFLRRQEL